LLPKTPKPHIIEVKLQVVKIQNWYQKYFKLKMLKNKLYDTIKIF